MGVGGDRRLLKYRIPWWRWAICSAARVFSLALFGGVGLYAAENCSLHDPARDPLLGSVRSKSNVCHLHGGLDGRSHANLPGSRWRDYSRSPTILYVGDPLWPQAELRHGSPSDA